MIPRILFGKDHRFQRFMIDWSQIKYFTPKERWGNPSMMNEKFVKKLDAFRAFVNHPIFITEGYAINGHSPNSYHYKGMAADCKFINKDLKFHVWAALHSPFGGVGIYTWGPFLHLDDRPHLPGKRTIWISHRPQIYEPFNMEFLDEVFK